MFTGLAVGVAAVGQVDALPGAAGVDGGAGDRAVRRGRCAETHALQAGPVWALSELPLQRADPDGGVLPIDVAGDVAGDPALPGVADVSSRVPQAGSQWIVFCLPWEAPTSKVTRAWPSCPVATNSLMTTSSGVAAASTRHLLRGTGGVGGIASARPPSPRRCGPGPGRCSTVPSLVEVVGALGGLPPRRRVPRPPSRVTW